MANIIMADQKGGGGVDYFQYARSLNNMFSIPYTTAYQFPFEEISINAPLVTSIGNFWSTGAFSSASQARRGVKKIKLSIQGVSSAGSWFVGTSDLEEIELHLASSSIITPNGSLFVRLPALKKITGVMFNGKAIQWTYDTGNNPIYLPSGSALEEIRFVPNSMSYNGTYQFAQHGNLSDDSLVSIANAMDASGSVNITKTIRLHSDVKDKLPSIMGTVSNDFFTLDLNGTTTLLDFITQTKGWTVS